MIGNPAWLFPHKANKHMVPLPTCYATTTTYNINIPQRQRNLKLPSINTYSNREENVQENRSSELSRREKRHITGAKKKKKKRNTMSSVAQKRLFHEYKNLSMNPPEGITAGPVSEDDMFLWEALIQGPEGTPYDGGVFAAELKFPKDYPLSPPSMKFVGGGVWHPNGNKQ